MVKITKGNDTVDKVGNLIGNIIGLAILAVIVIIVGMLAVKGIIIVYHWLFR